MKQVVPKHIAKNNKVSKKEPKQRKKHNSRAISKGKNDVKYGTSKLERDFARDFLDKYGINYIYQFEAKEIGRFFDFAITSDKRKYLKEEKYGVLSVKQGDPAFDLSFFIEIDGDYWHMNPETNKDKKPTIIQKHNIFVDKLKDQYAGMHCIPLVRFWEHDIRKNPKKVINELKKYINIAEKKQQIRENFKKPH